MNYSISDMHKQEMLLSAFLACSSNAFAFCSLHQDIMWKFNHEFQLPWLLFTISSNVMIHRTRLKLMVILIM